jgi:hypothetical protein
MEMVRSPEAEPEGNLVDVLMERRRVLLEQQRRVVQEKRSFVNLRMTKERKEGRIEGS